MNTDHHPAVHPALIRLLLVLFAVLLLALIFYAYLRPDFLLDTVNRFMMC
ncbi:hypothetical protein [Undibacterium squillarum]|uniref:Uncharacterized protein n=1 Tax=Undibacterium squillarum TaxID=1131567 RepID=A0ABQ2XY72_9BURK|nr:hypothetical protein [Undibacterium squillarum]GGX38833.1 hypothetical protein GCM10010946_16440 [Undibacterium squillarum]